jgi:hypothetical protein
MLHDALRLVGRKHLAYLALSLILFGYLAFVRDDTTRAELGFGLALVAALWVLAGIRAYMKQTERTAHRGAIDARR